MKIKIVIILIVVILMAFSVFAIKKYIDNSLLDKTGMVRAPEDDIVLVRYSEGGGMDGFSEMLEIRQSENGGAVVTYEYCSVTSGEDISKSAEVSFDAMKELRDICREYRIFSWGKLPEAEELILDAPVCSVLVSTQAESYSYNSNHIIPDYARGITNKLYNSMKKYLEGVD